MKVLKIIYAILFIFIIASSCRDKNSPVERKEYIITGNYAGLKVKKYDSILKGGYGNLQELVIDVDDDGYNDFQFSSNVWGSMGMGHHPETKIYSLSPKTLFNVITVNDTHFVHITTSIDTTSPDRVRYHKYYWISCWKDNNNDSIIWTGKNNYLRIFYDEYSIFRSGQWSDSTFELAMEEVSSSAPVWKDSNDTTYYVWHSYSYNCHYLPDNTVVYIGFKKINAGETRLGWIKLKVTDKLAITLIETAIQK
jgi:hypothetical protein